MKNIKIILAAILVSTCCSLAQAQNKNCFLIGSSSIQVKNVQGVPSKISKYSSIEVWYYGKSSISLENGKVIEFDNSANNLKICKDVIKTVTVDDVKERMGYLYPERSKSTASKLETQSWILSKLNNYISNNILVNYSSEISALEIRYNIKNTKFSFEDSYLIIRYDKDKGKNSYAESYKIPLWDIEKLVDYHGKLVITTKSKSMIYSQNYEEKKNYFSIEYDFASENNLQQRIASAFAHLSKFFKSPIINETF